MQRSRLKRLLIVSHEASCTGAPLLLLELVGFLVQHHQVKPHIVLVRGGELEREFSKWGKVTILKPIGYTNARGWRRWKMMLQNRYAVLFVFLVALRSEAVFSNSIINGLILQWLRYAGKPIYTYVHELKSVIDLYLKQGNAQGSFLYSKMLFYPCDTVKFLLEHAYHVESKKLARLNYYFSPDSRKYFSTTKIGTPNIRICGSGTASYRKGTDLFIQIANQVKKINPSIEFVWFGKFENEETELQYRKMNSSEHHEPSVIFTGAITPIEMKQQYQLFDAFLLSSREDPYPLVVIEAAFCKVPSLVFKSSGGIHEFVQDSGWVIEEMNPDLMTNCVLQLNKDEMRRRGEKAFEKAHSLHANPELISQQLNLLIHS